MSVKGALWTSLSPRAWYAMSNVALLVLGF
jgi:hypothetical protein